MIWIWSSEQEGKHGCAHGPFRRRNAKQAAAKRASMVAAALWQRVDDHTTAMQARRGCEWRWHPAHNLFIERNEMDRYWIERI